MGLNWEKLFKKYIWDDQTTPYLVSRAKLNRRQADCEILVYSLFLGVLFVVVGIASLSTVGPHGRSLGVAFYAFSVVCAATVFGIGKSYVAALYLSATHLAGLAFVFLYGLGSEREMVDTIVVAVILVLLLRYSFRMVGIARLYPEMPEAPDSQAGRRRIFRE